MVSHPAPPRQPTQRQIDAALGTLPDGFAAIGLNIVHAAGATADTLLICADAFAEGARERRSLFPAGDMEITAMEALAAILRDAAPRYPHPPRLPAQDTEMQRRAHAAGLSTACIRAQDEADRYPCDRDIRGTRSIGGEP